MHYYKAFDKSGYHSAFMTTYAFSVGAFEDAVLPRLRNAGCRNVHVLSDANMANVEFAEIGPPKFAGTLYNLIKVHAPTNAAFHPKIVLQLGRRKTRLLVGSANLTGPGLAGNMEIVTEILCDEENQKSAPLIRYAFEYILGWARNNEVLTEAARLALSRTPVLWDIQSEQTITLVEDSDVVSFLTDTGTTPIVDQLRGLVGSDDIERLTIVSPYWDAALRGLKAMVEIADGAPLHVLLDQDEPVFPIDKLGDLKPKFHSLDWPKKRFTHAKVLLLEGRSFDHLVTGSINCSWPALSGQSLVSGNAEAGIYRRLPVGEGIRILGLEAVFSSTIEPHQIEKPNNETESVESASLALDGGRLVSRLGVLDWIYPHEGVASATISLFNANGEIIDPLVTVAGRGKARWRVQTNCDLQDVSYGLVNFADGRVSAPVVVDHTESLRRSAAPKERNATSRYTDHLNHLVDEDLDILECIDQLERADLGWQDAENKATIAANKTDSSAQETPASAKKLTYEDFVRTSGHTSQSVNRPSIVGGKRVEEVSRALDRLLGIMSAHTNELADAELERGHVDLNPVEMGKSVEDVLKQGGSSETLTPALLGDDTAKKAAAARRRRNQEMANKIKDAVSDFEKRLRNSKTTEVTAVDLIRIRYFLQLICAFGSAVGAEASDEKPLPSWSKDGSDWPRLIGRVLKSIMQLGKNPFASLEIETEIAMTPQEVISAWGSALWCAQAASLAASRVPNNFIKERLDAVRDRLRVTILASVSENQSDVEAITAFATAFGERFADRLNVKLPPNALTISTGNKSH